VLDHLRTIATQALSGINVLPIPEGMGHNELVPINAGPVPDRLAIWPIDDGRYGLDATFQGASGCARAERHEAELARQGVPYSLKQELDGGWTLRFGPLRAIDVAKALGAFVY
jgi:hypothetical protein